MELRFLILYFLSLSFASAQTNPHEELILQQVQETQGNPDLLDFILQEWEYRKSHKIRLNFCQAEELEALGILDIFQVHNLLQYRRRYGLIFGPRELVFIKGFDRDLIRLLEPILDFSTHKEVWSWQWSEIIAHKKQELLLRVQPGEPEPSAQYAGDPLESRIIYDFQSKVGIQLRFNLQKDPGELWWSRTGPDHLAGFVRYQAKGKVRQIIMGDYHVNFGLGISTWSGMQLDIANITSPFLPGGRGIKAFAGNEENRFFRGLAISSVWKNWSIQGFISRRKLDARYYRSGWKVNYTGFHRSQTEIQGKNQLGLNSVGASLKYHGSNWSLEWMHIRHQFNRSPPKALPHQTWRPPLSKYLNHALFGQILISGIHLFGEISFDQNFRPAFIVAWQQSFRDKIKIRQQYRFHHYQFQSLWSQPPGEGNPGGERAWRLQLSVQWSPSQRSLLHLDLQHLPHPQSSIIKSSKNRALSLQHEIKTSRRGKWDFQWKNSFHEELSIHNKTWTKLISSRDHFRIQYQRRLSSNWEILESVQISRQANLLGWARLLGIRASYIKKAWNLRGGFAMSISDPGHRALYLYEPDIKLGFSIPAFRNQSLRTFARVSWNHGAWLLETKWTKQFTLAETISTSKLKFQVIYSF